MCGIAGIAGLRDAPADPRWAQEAARMADCMRHRGPDDGGVWQSADGLVLLAHRRLSIVDLSPLGHNPMPWDNGRLWITFNGEVYNFREMRAELEALGHRFRSQTDTEVILAAYDAWGTDAVLRLVGMFAFAVWDSLRNRLWVVRDRLGKKPIYYSQAGGVLRFASELKALVRTGAVPLDVDDEALRLYLRYGYVPSPHSIYAQVRKLPPAHMLLVEGGRVRVERYWDPLAAAVQAAPLARADARAALEERLATAVRQRMIADVPLGAFLSGGIDSSLIVALMREQGQSRVRTFTVRFEVPEFNEADHAAAVAAHLGTEHHEQPCGDGEMLEVVDRLPAMFDEPFADSSAVPTYLVSKAARAHVTVALSGDGGDELFFGYPRYAYHAQAGWLLRLGPTQRRALAAIARRLPTRRMRRAADVLSNDDADTYSRFVTWFGAADVTAMAGAEAPPGWQYAEMLARARAAGLAAEDIPPLLDLVSYLPEDILTKVDRASMAVSLEVRAPLLDHRVVELALALPRSLKWQQASGKLLLRQMLFDRVPKALVDRPKAGFGVPLEQWFRGPLRERMAAYCSSGVFEGLGLNPKPIRQMWADFERGQGPRGDLLWQIFMLAAWATHRAEGAQAGGGSSAAA